MDYLVQALFSFMCGIGCFALGVLAERAGWVILFKWHVRLGRLETITDVESFVAKRQRASRLSKWAIALIEAWTLWMAGEGRGKGRGETDGGGRSGHSCGNGASKCHRGDSASSDRAPSTQEAE